jgi:hypothetical protein
MRQIVLFLSINILNFKMSWICIRGNIEELKKIGKRITFRIVEVGDRDRHYSGEMVLDQAMQTYNPINEGMGKARVLSL